MVDPCYAERIVDRMHGRPRSLVMVSLLGRAAAVDLAASSPAHAMIVEAAVEKALLRGGEG